MRLAIINITGGGISGGYFKYLKNILPRLSGHNEIKSILCAIPETIDIREELTGNQKISLINYTPKKISSDIERQLSSSLKNFDPNVLFVPVERPFRFSDIPIVNMVQNMETFIGGFSNNPFMEQLKCKLRLLSAKKALNQSTRIIAVSKFVRSVLYNRLKVPAEKMSLVYYGSQVPGLINQKPEMIPKAWENRFIFTAGSIRPGRGLEDLVMAMPYIDFIKNDIGGIVIAGKTDLHMEKYHKDLLYRIKENKMTDRVCWTGDLSESEMSYCFDNCKLFVMTSRVESFGMIALEALEHGCLCISTDNPCLPEIFSDAALFYPSGEPEVLASKIDEISCSDLNKTIKKSYKSRSRAAEFSWDVCAEKTVNVFESAIRDHSN